MCDVDGFTSSTILYKYLKTLNPNKQIDYFLHKGKQHGLEDMWELLQEKDYCVILVPDAGSNDSQYAVNLNIPILILDHHILEDDNLAKNMIIINNITIKKSFLPIDISPFYPLKSSKIERGKTPITKYSIYTIS